MWSRLTELAAVTASFCSSEPGFTAYPAPEFPHVDPRRHGPGCLAALGTKPDLDSFARFWPSANAVAEPVPLPMPPMPVAVTMSRFFVIVLLVVR